MNPSRSDDQLDPFITSVSESSKITQYSGPTLLAATLLAALLAVTLTVMTRLNQSVGKEDRTDELPNYRIASGKCCIRSDGYRAIGAATDTPRGGRGRLYDAIVAKCAGLHHFGRTQSLALETRWYADQVNESVFEGRCNPAFSHPASLPEILRAVGTYY